MEQPQEDWPDQLGMLEARLNRLEAENQGLQRQVTALRRKLDQRGLELAYQYIYLHWLWIRWMLLRDQDQAGADSALSQRAKGCEDSIWYVCNRYLRQMGSAPQPMELALKWRIECTVILNRHGYTFLD